MQAHVFKTRIESLEALLPHKRDLAWLGWNVMHLFCSSLITSSRVKEPTVANSISFVHAPWNWIQRKPSTCIQNMYLLEPTKDSLYSSILVGNSNNHLSRIGKGLSKEALSIYHTWRTMRSLDNYTLHQHWRWVEDATCNCVFDS